MKKIITLSLLCAFSMGMNAQTTVADFESDVDATKYTITGADETEQSAFELYATNPDKTGVNATNKCLHIKSNQVYFDDYANVDGRPTWNGNVFYITFEEPVTVDDANKYLHIMHLKGAILNKSWLVWAENGDGNYVELGRGNTAEANVWFDIVVDMSAKLSTVKTIRVHLDGNWGQDTSLRFYEPTDFYYDEIIMNDDATARGAEPIVPITDQNIIDFEDETVTSDRITTTVQNAAFETNTFAENPEKGGANTSNRCATFYSSTAKPAWWHGFYFTFNRPLVTKGNQYLHIMMKKDVEEASNAQISLVDNLGTASAPLISNPITTEWTDYVMEIPSSCETVSGIYVKFNTAIGTTCYFDEMYMDNDPNPRAGIVSGIENSNVAQSVVCVNGNTITAADASHSMQVYNLLGSLVFDGKGSYETEAAGIYVVRVNNTVQKVAVK